MYKLIITINQIKFEWQILDTPSAILWMKLLKHQLCSKENFYIRSHGFPFKSEDHILNILKKALSIIVEEGGAEDPHFDLENWNQTVANQVHHFFDDLYGITGNETKFFIQSPMRVQWALGVVNHCVHQLETNQRDHSILNSAKSIVFEACNNIKRLNFPDSFNEDFELNVEPGSLVLHYSTVGKTWIEAFTDNDDEIPVNKIIPHQRFSCEFDILFSNPLGSEEQNKLFNFIRKKGVDPSDPKLGLGFIPLATINSDEAASLKKVLESGKVDFNMIDLMKDESVLASKTLENIIESPEMDYLGLE